MIMRKNLILLLLLSLIVLITGCGGGKSGLSDNNTKVAQDVIEMVDVLLDGEMDVYDGYDLAIEYYDALDKSDSDEDAIALVLTETENIMAYINEMLEPMEDGVEETNGRKILESRNKIAKEIGEDLRKDIDSP
jgi:hypothetical protein